MDTIQVYRCLCGFSSPQFVMEDWNIAHCPQCGEVTGLGEPDTLGKAEITDTKLLARVRRLIITEYAGFIRQGYGRTENACIEPGCSCGFGVCGCFRNPPVRCTSFENKVLPLDPNLEEAYWAHIRWGAALLVRRCAWPGCRREAGAINAKFCGPHALLSIKRSKREYAQRRRAAQRGGE